MTLLLGATVSTTAHPTVVVVFDIEDPDEILREDSRERITDYVSGKVGEVAKISLVPRGDVDALRALKAESYRNCYDEACQIELGKELAAEKVIRLKVLKFEKTCVAKASLIDLEKRITNWASSLRSACSEGALVSAFEGLVNDFRNSREEPARLSITSEPPADVQVDSLDHGRTPIDVQLQPGTHEIRFEAPGHKVETRKLKLSSGDRRRLSISLTERSLTEAEINQRTKRYAFWGCLIGTAAAITMSTIYGVRVVSSKAKLDSLPPGDPTREDLISSAETSALVLDVSAIAALILGASTIALSL